eukprot:g5523.t1
MAVNDAEGPSEGARTAVHATCASVSLCLALYSLYKVLQPRLRGVFFFRIPPAICICVTYDNVVEAARAGPTALSVEIGRTVNAAIVPMCLVLCWEVGYLIHKRRSTNFCCITFDASHRSHDKLGMITAFLRFFVWGVALFLFVLTLLVNYAIAFDADGSLSAGTHGLYDLGRSDNMHYALSLVAPIALLVFSFVIGGQLWNYGTYYSLFKTHATYCNPWNWMVVGTVCLAVGHALPASVYALTANAGEVLFLLCVIRMLSEVEGELEMQDDFLNKVINAQDEDGSVRGAQESAGPSPDARFAAGGGAADGGGVRSGGDGAARTLARDASRTSDTGETEMVIPMPRQRQQETTM